MRSKSARGASIAVIIPLLLVIGSLVAYQFHFIPNLDPLILPNSNNNAANTVTTSIQFSQADSIRVKDSLRVLSASDELFYLSVTNSGGQVLRFVHLRVAPEYLWQPWIFAPNIVPSQTWIYNQQEKDWDSKSGQFVTLNISASLGDNTAYWQTIPIEAS